MENSPPDQKLNNTFIWIKEIMGTQSIFNLKNIKMYHAKIHGMELKQNRGKFIVMILYSALQTRKGTTEIQDKHAIKRIIKIRMEIHELDKETTEEKKKSMEPKSGSFENISKIDQL